MNRKLILFSLLLFAAAAFPLPCPAAYTVVSNAEKPPVMQTEPDGAVYYDTVIPAEAVLDPGLELKQGEIMRVRFSLKNLYRKFAIRFGEKNFFAVSLRPDGNALTLWDSRKTRYPNIILNPTANRSFAWSDTLLWRTDILNQRFTHPRKDEIFEMTAEKRSEDILISVNGMAFAVLPCEGPLTFAVARGVRIYPAEILPCADPLFRPLDIRSRLNADSVNGRKTALKPGMTTLGSVPFMIPEAKDSYTHIDAGQSWIREGALVGVQESPKGGSFGGRWAGAPSANPSRIQFSIPTGDYNAVYLLAAFSDEKNTIPRVSAQFFRPYAGFPKTFSSNDIPAYTAQAECQSIELPFTEGAPGRLFLVKIPVQPGMLDEFSDLNTIGLELTKDTATYRAYPDPCYYSVHGAGLPSGVRIFAVTLGMDPVKVTFTPDQFANVFPEQEKVSYTVKLLNRSAEKQVRKLHLSAVSLDGTDKFDTEREASLAPDAETELRFEIPAKRYGHYDVRLTVDGIPFTHSFARLRERDHSLREFDAKGHMFGFWDWRGSHTTPPQSDAVKIMGAAGAESWQNGAIDQGSEPFMKKYGMRLYFAFEGVKGGASTFTVSYLTKNDPDDEVLYRKFRTAFETGLCKKSDLRDPRIVRFFAEPSSFNAHGTRPEYYGEPAVKYADDPAQKKAWDHQYRLFRLALKAAKDVFPGVKILMPHGSPAFVIPFLEQQNDETKQIDGCAIDFGFFERLPEQQFHQNSIHRMLMVNDAFRKYKKEKPLYVTVEGPCLSLVAPGAMTADELTCSLVRIALLLSAYGVNRQFSCAGAADCADYWGEQHYGGGLFTRLNDLNPYPAYSAYASMTRHLRSVEFRNWLPTGTLSLYALKFTDESAGRDLYAVWNLTGKREVIIRGIAGNNVSVFDLMDNETVLPVSDGKVSLTADGHPLFVYAQGDVSFEAGKTDHSDAVPAEHRILLGTADKLFVKQSQDSDDPYVNAFPDCIRRFPAEMQIERKDGKLLITLPPQKKSRGVCPFYTTLTPEKPVAIPGKPDAVTFRVTAHSDWGRIVCVLRDASGKLFYSCGAKGKWNCDDMRNESFFRFDGERLIRFALPSALPWDRFLEPSMANWGVSSGSPDPLYPLSLEKIFVERRSEAMYVNSLEKTDPAPVEIGEIHAEYASKDKMTPEAAAHANLSMPQPDAAALPNFITELAAKATPELEASEILKVEEPESWNDGTRGIFTFREMPDAKYYEIYLSAYPDGRGAIRLGKDLKKSGVLIRGFRADMDFYAFIVWYDAKRRQSRVSVPFKFRLEDHFGMK